MIIATLKAAPSSSTQLPLFYKRLELLSRAEHGRWRIKLTDLSFAAEAQFVPVAASEFREAGHHYPLLFGAGEHLPLALLGLHGGNSFLTGGSWQADAYVPAYVRRYPFLLTSLPTGRLALSIDADAPHLVKSGLEGHPLYQDGKPSPVLEHAWQFCELFAQEFAATEDFVKLLVEHKLLVERTLEVALPSQQRTSLVGFYVVDVGAFEALPEAVLGDWHRRGILAMIYAHLSSLNRLGAPHTPLTVFS